jgi:hypothetical protein
LEHIQLRVSPTILSPHRSAQINNGSVTVLAPEPSENAEAFKISCNVPEAGTNNSSSGKDPDPSGVSSDMSIGITDVSSLYGIHFFRFTQQNEDMFAHFAGKIGTQASRHFNADCT